MSFASLREKKPLLGAGVGNADSKEHSEEQKKAFLCGKLRQCLKNPKTKAFANHQLSLQAFPFFVHLPPTALASVAEIFQKFYKVGRFDGPLHAGWLKDRSPVCPCATVPVSSAASPSQILSLSLPGPDILRPPQPAQRPPRTSPRAVWSGVCVHAQIFIFQPTRFSATDGDRDHSSREC